MSLLANKTDQKGTDLIPAPEPFFRLRIMKQIQRNLTNNLGIQKMELGGLDWNAHWHILPEKQPVPQRLKDDFTFDIYAYCTEHVSEFMFFFLYEHKYKRTLTTDVLLIIARSQWKSTDLNITATYLRSGSVSSQTFGQLSG